MQTEQLNINVKEINYASATDIRKALDAGALPSELAIQSWLQQRELVEEQGFSSYADLLDYLSMNDELYCHVLCMCYECGNCPLKIVGNKAGCSETSASGAIKVAQTTSDLLVAIDSLIEELNLVAEWEKKQNATKRRGGNGKS